MLAWPAVRTPPDATPPSAPSTTRLASLPAPSRAVIGSFGALSIFLMPGITAFRWPASAASSFFFSVARLATAAAEAVPVPRAHDGAAAGRERRRDLGLRGRVGRPGAGLRIGQAGRRQPQEGLDVSHLVARGRQLGGELRQAGRFDGTGRAQLHDVHPEHQARDVVLARVALVLEEDGELAGGPQRLHRGEHVRHVLVVEDAPGLLRVAVAGSDAPAALLLERVVHLGRGRPRDGERPGAAERARDRRVAGAALQGEDLRHRSRSRHAGRRPPGLLGRLRPGRRAAVRFPLAAHLPTLPAGVVVRITRSAGSGPAADEAPDRCEHRRGRLQHGQRRRGRVRLEAELPDGHRHLEQPGHPVGARPGPRGRGRRRARWSPRSARRGRPRGRSARPRRRSRSTRRAARRAEARLLARARRRSARRRASPVRRPESTWKRSVATRWTCSKRTPPPGRAHHSARTSRPPVSAAVTSQRARSPVTGFSIICPAIAISVSFGQDGFAGDPRRRGTPGGRGSSPSAPLPLGGACLTGTLEACRPPPPDLAGREGELARARRGRSTGVRGGASARRRALRRARHRQERAARRARRAARRGPDRAARPRRRAGARRPLRARGRGARRRRRRPAPSRRHAGARARRVLPSLAGGRGEPGASGGAALPAAPRAARRARGAGRPRAGRAAARRPPLGRRGVARVDPARDAPARAPPAPARRSRCARSTRWPRCSTPPRPAGRRSTSPLAPLADAAAHALLADVPDAQRRRVVAEAGGNPLFLQGLARAPGARLPAAGPCWPRWSSSRSRALPPASRALLEGAAVVGDPFDADLAAVAAGLDDDADVALDAAGGRRARAARDGARLRFRHPLVRRAVYDAAPAGWRIAAHERVAAALAARGVDAGRRSPTTSSSRRGSATRTRPGPSPRPATRRAGRAPAHRRALVPRRAAPGARRWPPSSAPRCSPALAAGAGRRPAAPPRRATSCSSSSPSSRRRRRARLELVAMTASVEHAARPAREAAAPASTPRSPRPRARRCARGWTSSAPSAPSTRRTSRRSRRSPASRPPSCGAPSRRSRSPTRRSAVVGALLGRAARTSRRSASARMRASVRGARPRALAARPEASFSAGYAEYATENLPRGARRCSPRAWTCIRDGGAGPHARAAGHAARAGRQRRAATWRPRSSPPRWPRRPRGSLGLDYALQWTLWVRATDRRTCAASAELGARLAEECLSISDRIGDLLVTRAGPCDLATLLRRTRPRARRAR